MKKDVNPATYVYINDTFISGINTINIEDVFDDKENKSYTNITLQRIVSGSDEIINHIRTNRFNFKLCNLNHNYGYKANDVEVIKFNMSINADDNFLRQTIVMRTVSFFYDAKTMINEISSVENDDDTANLIKIIKEHRNQMEKAKRTVVLPSTDSKQDVVVNECGGISGGLQDVIDRLNMIQEQGETQTEINRLRSKAQSKLNELKEDEMVWANVKDPSKLEGFVKPRKLKKKKKQ